MKWTDLKTDTGDDQRSWWNPCLTKNRKKPWKPEEVDFAYTDTRVGRFRVNAFHQRGSYAAVLRIVASDIPTPEDLGVPEAVLGLTKKKRGLVLVTGPTGSGKSTTPGIFDRCHQ